MISTSLEMLMTFSAAAHVLLMDRLLFNASCVGKGWKKKIKR